MSKQLSKHRERRGDVTPSHRALSMFYGDKDKHVNKAARKGAFIDSRKLENQRRMLEKRIYELEFTFDRLTKLPSVDVATVMEWPSEKQVEFCERMMEREVAATDGEALANTIVGWINAEREKLMTYFQMLSTYIIAVGTVHNSDYNCIQFPKEFKEKNPQTGEIEVREKIVRFTIADITSLLCDLVEGFDDKEDPEGGVYGRFDMMTEMLNDIGNRMEAFKDENTIQHDPHKYLGKPPSSKVKADDLVKDEAEEEENDPRAVTDEELQQAREGKIEIPDMRQKGE